MRISGSLVKELGGEHTGTVCLSSYSISIDRNKISHTHTLEVESKICSNVIHTVYKCTKTNGSQILISICFSTIGR
uniref:Uncharacterized protein n=1 Tax=Anguilla anguilla TaxID=7936 RepID=A0A0E9S5C3_ANGAN